MRGGPGGARQAVREALGYMERSAAAVRRGAGGARVEEAGGFVAAAFRHRTSRAGDPQLHTHVLVANLGRGPTGDGRRWTAGGSTRMRAPRASFTRPCFVAIDAQCGGGWSPVRNGIAEVVGVRRLVLAGFEPAAGGHRGGARAVRYLGRPRVGSGRAGDTTGEGSGERCAGS